jgi:hypothetical protein
MPVDEEGDTRVNHESIKDIQGPFMLIQITSIPLSEFHQSIYRPNLIQISK